MNSWVLGGEDGRNFPAHLATGVGDGGNIVGNLGVLASSLTAGAGLEVDIHELVVDYSKAIDSIAKLAGQLVEAADVGARAAAGGCHWWWSAMALDSIAGPELIHLLRLALLLGDDNAGKPSVHLRDLLIASTRLPDFRRA